MPSPQSSGLTPRLPLGSLSWIDTCLGCKTTLAWLPSRQMGVHPWLMGTLVYLEAIARVSQPHLRSTLPGDRDEPETALSPVGLSRSNRLEMRLGSWAELKC